MPVARASPYVSVDRLTTLETTGLGTLAVLTVLYPGRWVCDLSRDAVPLMCFMEICSMETVHMRCLKVMPSFPAQLFD